MHPVIESIRRISVEKFYASRGQMQSISAQNGEVSVLSEQFFFSENCDLFVNMHLYRPPFTLPEPKPSQLHKHDFYEIVFVYAGNAVNTVQSGGKLTRLAMGQGDICLLNPNAEHRLEIGSEEDTVLNILVKKQFFNLGFQEAIGQNNLLHSFFTDSLFEKKAVDHYLYFENRLCPGMKDSAFALAAESARGDIDSPVKLKGYLFLLFADLLTAYRNGLDEGSLALPTSYKISEILSYLIQNSRTVTLSEAAEHFHYHAQYLSRLLKQYTQKGFSELVREIKLKKAVSLLMDSSKTVSEIAEETGFQDAYFYKLFRDRYGCSPTEYRHRLQRETGTFRR